MKTGSYFEMISDVARQEMEWVGVEPYKNMPETFMHIEAVRRVQVWTLEWLAQSLKDGDPMREMFEQLADGVRHVPDMDLALGEPGASGSW